VGFAATDSWGRDVKKTVDVFVQDRLIASYPMVLEEIDPTDEDFVDRIKRYMRRHYSKEDIAAAKFIVRNVPD
jgi:hypothetical protein